MNNKILITGAGGYVGAKLVPALLEKNYSVTALDLFIYGKEVLDEHKNLKVVVGDIRNINILKEIIPGHDAVIHLACISNDPSFELNPQLGQSINLDAFEPLVQISKKEKIKRFIYASSSSVYGLKSEKNVTEDVSLEPLTDYSKFKVECEKILKPFNSEEFTTVTIRPATVCGYSRRQRLDVVVNILTNLAFNKREISIFGGKQLRPNIHIDDMVRSYILMLEAKKDDITGEVYNVGYDNLSIENIATKVKNIIGEDVKLKTTPTDDNRSYHISSSKIQKQLDFSPMFGVDDAIRDLKLAFEKKLLPNSLSDDVYFNIKRMEKIKLK